MDINAIRDNTKGWIMRFAVPSIIAMVLTAMITVTDGFFIGNYVGKEGVAAVNLGLPIVYLFLGMGLMLSVGGMAIAGMALGADDRRKCCNVFNQTVLTVIIVSIMVSAVVSLCLRPTLFVLGAKELVSNYFLTYFRIMLFAYPFMILVSSLGMFVRAEGYPQFVMMTTVISVILNVIGDYVMAAVFRKGIAGIAYASLISEIVTALVLVLFFMTKSPVFRFHTFRFNGKVLRDSILNGSSEFIGEMSGCLSMFAFNFVIMKYIGADGVTAFTVGGYIEFIFSMILIGFGQGASPLISFAYGAQDHATARKIRKDTSRFVFTAGAVLYAVTFLTADWYSTLFVRDAAVSGMIVTGIRILAVSFFFSGYNCIASFYFTSIGRARESAVISSARGLVVLLIAIITLPYCLGMIGVWMVAPVTEILSMIVSIYYVTGDEQRNI